MAKPGRDGNPLDLRVARGHERSGKSESVVRNVNEHPMDRLLHRGTIEGHQHEAGARLLRDWEAAAVGQARAWAVEPRVDNSRRGDVTISQAVALSRVNGAMRDIGHANRQIVMALVIARMDLDTVGERMRSLGFKWPHKRYGGPRVCEALQALSDHYGETKNHLEDDEDRL